MNIDPPTVEHLVAEIERQRDLLEAILEQFPAGVIVLDDPPTGRISRVSKLYGALWGRSCTPGQPYAGHALRHPAWYPKGRRLGDEDFGGARALRGEIVLQELIIERCDGTTCPVLDIAAPLRDRHGRIVGSVAALHDLRDEKAKAREREQLVEEARRAVRAREDVLAILSHDLRDHLAVVALGAAHLARSPEGADRVLVGQIADRIQRAASGMDRIIADLLDGARIEEEDP